MFRLDGFLRQQVLTLHLLLLGFTTFLGYCFSPVETVAWANLVVSVLALCLLAVVRVRTLFKHLVHATTGLTVLLVVYTALQTGGINSTAVVWLHVLSVPVLLMLGRSAALLWIGVMLMAILGLTLLTWWGWVSHLSYAPSSVVTWAYLNHALALLNLMVGVRIYEHFHQVQLRKLHRRHDQLKAKHEALSRAQAHQDEFLAAVGHELRTPMNVILGFNSVLHRELANEPAELALVGHIRQSTEQLLQVVNDILDFSQLQAGQLRLNPVDFALQALLDELQQRHLEKAKAKQVNLQFELDRTLPARVHGDRNRLLQIMNNLVGNAVQFTSQGSVRVALTSCSEGWRFEVKDTGRGIPRARLKHIFRRFEHAEVQTNRADGGTGLGLTLCEKLVTLQGGRIGVESQEGQGSHFWFEMPLQAAQTQDVPEPVPDDGWSEEPLRMLVVDDNKVNLMVAQLQLQKCWPHATITTVDSGAKALRVLDQQVFDVALIDMVMPDMDGMQLTQQIRQHVSAITVNMPILALTANTHAEDRDRCLGAGMNDVLHKPMDTSMLMAAVARCVRRAREGVL